MDPNAILLASLRAKVRGLDVDALSPGDAVVLVDWFAEVERLGAAGKALAAKRAAEGNQWRASGERTAADWLAKRTGSTVGEARAALDTAARLPAAPGTDAAFRSGALSVKQAEAVSAGAEADPSAESRLLQLAGCRPLKMLQDEAARARAAAETDQRARHERIRRERFWRRWTDADGARCGMYRLTPEDAAVLETRAQPFIVARIDEARRTGQWEPSDALAADGLVAMAAASGVEASPARGARGRKRLRNRRELIGIVNLESLHRGRVESGETCEIAGVGPVPVDVVREVFGDALLRIVIRDGKDIRTVVHTGRTASALQETAVLVRSGGWCERPACDLPISEIDHKTGFPETGPVALGELLGLCGHDHDLKSRHGHRYEVDVDGNVTWIPPNGAEARAMPP